MHLKIDLLSAFTDQTRRLHYCSKVEGHKLAVLQSDISEDLFLFYNAF